MSNYRAKAKDSFNTRMRFFKFHCVINTEDFNIVNFLKFRIDDALITLFTAQYYQWEQNQALEGVKCTLTINQIYERMKLLEDNHKLEFESWFADYFEQEFKIQYPEISFTRDSNAKECNYCGITLTQINELASKQKLYKKNERGFVMEIDRKKPNHEYTNDNCVSACYWCNNAKTDEFNDIEFAPIGKLIGATLRKRLEL